MRRWQCDEGHHFSVDLFFRCVIRVPVMFRLPSLLAVLSATAKHGDFSVAVFVAVKASALNSPDPPKRQNFVSAGLRKTIFVSSTAPVANRMHMEKPASHTYLKKSFSWLWKSFAVLAFSRSFFCVGDDNNKDNEKRDTQDAFVDVYACTYLWSKLVM
jgi:hypothetical protein